MLGVLENVIRGAVAPLLRGVANIRRSRLKPPPGGNPYLQGIHAPLSIEHNLFDLEVIGTIPPELDGEYIRIGPNPLEVINEGAHHWFVGDGMVHGVRLKGSKAQWYRNRWIRSTKISLELKEEPKPGPRDRYFDNPNTNVLEHAGKIWALVEAGGYPAELTPELDTVAHNPFSGTLKSPFSAHPHRDPDTGELHAICYAGADQSAIWYVVVDTAGKVRRTVAIPVKNGPSIHDCMITEQYVIVMDLPVTFSMKAMLSGAMIPYRWNKSHKARIGLLPREGSAEEIIWCSIDPCYIFHIANAFEQEGKVIVDAVVHASMFAAFHYGPAGTDSTFERLTLDPATKSVERQVISTDNQEFPRVDERITGKPYRYAYCVSMGEQSLAGSTDARLFKYDLKTGKRQIHDFDSSHALSEFVFVAKNEHSGEDEGWVMGYVVDHANNQTKLTILNADDFEAEPCAVVVIPHRIPSGFHGNWVAATRLSN